MNSATEKKLDPDQINVILATDCGSTTTKAILIEKVNGEYRQTYRGEAPTTVEEPAADVTVGVVNAVTEVGELAGRKLIDENGEIIRPAQGDVGCDIYISTSSAGGGLQMMVAGVVREMSAASAKRAALGAGAIVMDTICSNDKRLPHEQIQRIRELRPDMILLAGGTDGGTQKHVVQLAELIAPAKPQPRFGGTYKMPIIYAGNQEATELVEEAFDEDVKLTTVANVRPVLELENLAPARDAIHDLFLEHVMAHAPGYNKLISWADAPIMPTPGAVGNILQTIAERQGINALGVDIGGATTDVFSVFDGTFNRTVSANLGMSYSISNVCASATLPMILRWVHLNMDPRALQNHIKNKMIRPTTIPQTREALVFEQAVAREALRLAYIQHKEFATTLKGVQQQRTVGDTFSQETSGQSIVDNMKLNLLVGSGGVLSHAPNMQQTAAMMIDAFEPEGMTVLAKDSIFMMPHLGVLAQVHPAAALQVFERDCLIYLGTCIAPRGFYKAGKTCFEYKITGKTLNESGEMVCGDMRLFPLGDDEWATVTVEPRRGYDFGEGSGKRVEFKARGGTVGLILDARGRPLMVPADESRHLAELNSWVEELKLYPEVTQRTDTMTQAYSPGLQVRRQTLHSSRRILPIPGDVLVKVGEQVSAQQIVAQTFMPGDVTPINVANQISVAPSEVPGCMLFKEGDEVQVGDLLARSKGIFGFFKSETKAKTAGTIESISHVTGQVILRGAPLPIQVRAYQAGVVKEVIPEQGVVIESEVTFLQGILGIGGEAYGTIQFACQTKDQPLTEELLDETIKGKVVIGGARMTGTAVKRGIELGAAAIVSGGIDDEDLKEILGYDLGVAVTGSEHLGTTLIITEGFGDIAMAERTFNLLKEREGAEAAVNGTTQIRAGVLRPEIVIPLDKSMTSDSSAEDAEVTSGLLQTGVPVRIIRDPYFGLLGEVGEMPTELRTLESGSQSRVLEVILDSGEKVIVPRANVELIEG